MRKVTQMRRRGRKRLFTVILYLCLLLAVIFIVFVKTFELKELEIEGNTRYTAQELEELLMTKPTDRVSVLFWLRMKWWGADPIPFVEKVETDLIIYFQPIRPFRGLFSLRNISLTFAFLRAGASGRQGGSA